MRNVARLIAAGTTSLLLVGLAPGIAHAAATRTAAVPTAGSSVTTPNLTTISATFNGEGILVVPTAPTFTVTPPAGDTHFACPIDAVAPGANHLSCTPSHVGQASFTEGLYTASYTFTSVPGGSTSGSFTFTVDDTGPALASSVPTAAGTERPKASAGTVKNGYVATANEALGATSDVVVKDGSNATVPGSKSVTGSTVSFTPTTALTVGSYTADVTLVDLAGNSTTVPTRSFTVDLPPAPTSLAISPNPYSKAFTSSPITVTGKSESSGDSVLVTLTSSGGGSPLTSTVTATAGGNFGASFSGSVPDGTLTATAVTTDAGGNTGATATATAAKDLVSPTLLSTSPDNGASEKSSTLGVPNGITAVGSEVLNQTSSTITISKGGVTFASTRSFPSTTSIKATPVDVLPEGTYTASITLVDGVGNSSGVLTRTFVIDDSAPVAPSYSPGPAVINVARKAAYTVSGTGEPGATVALTITDSALSHVDGTAVVAGNGTWTITKDVSGLVDGSVALSATQTDTAGNTSPAAVAGTLKDTVAPRVTGVGFDHAQYKAGAPITAVITGLVDNGTTSAGEAGDGVIVTVKDGTTGTASGVGVTDGTGHFSVSVNITSLGDGPLTAEAVATDAAGNVSLKGLAAASKDTGAPVTPTVSMTNPINAANKTAVVVSGTAEADSTIDVSINDTDNGTVALTAHTTALGDGTWSITKDVSTLTDGTLTSSVVSTDGAGNASSTGTATATKDVTSPAAPGLTVPAYVSAANVAAVPVSGTAEALSTVLVHVTDSGAGVVDKVATTSAGGAWSTSLDLTSLAEGPLSISATAADAAGNPGIGTTKPSTKDTVAPGTPSTTLAPTTFDYAHRADDLVVSGTVAVPDQGDGGLTADITVSDGPGTADLVASVPVTSDAFTHTFTNAQVLFFPDSQLSVRVSIRDAAGNTGVSDVTPLLKDVSKLAVASSSPSAGGSAQSVSTVVVTFNEALVTGTDPNAPPYSAITVKKGGITLAGSNAFTNGNKTMTFTPASALPEGTYDVFVHATDVNDSGDVINDDAGVTPTFSFSVDVTPPVAPSVSSVTDPVNSVNKTAVAVSGNATEQGLTVTVTITGTTGSVSKSATSGAGGAYTVSGIDVSSLPDGTLTAVAASTDAAGNAGPSGGTKTATKETVLPTVSGLAATASHYSAFTTTVTGTLSEAGTVALTATDGTHTASGSGTVAGNRTFTGTLDLSTFTTGSVTVTARATDTAGNPGPVASTTTTHDAAVPPGKPTAVAATAGDRKASVAFTAPASTGGAPITSYTVVSSGGQTATGTSSPIVVTGLTDAVAYTFTVKATNRAGTGVASDASNAVTPMGVSSVALNALPARIVYGSYLTVGGVVHRTDGTAPFGTVKLYTRTDAGVVRLLVTRSVTTTGAWTYRFRPSTNLTYYAVYGGDTVNKASAASTRRKVYVAVRISASAPTGSHRVNQVITGAVAPSKAGKPIYLYRVTSTGSLVKLASATISSTSTYRFSVRLPAGKTKLRVLVPTTTNNYAGSVTFTATRS